jgi:DNA-binding response OmpR family regulator
MKPRRPLILLLEDDAPSAEALGLVLRDWGADVVHCPDPDDALTAAGAPPERVGVIITDFHLGAKKNGVSVAKTLNKRAPQAHVLILSGSLSNDAERAAAEAGYAFMPKPAQADDIIAWIEERQRRAG